MRIFGSYRWRLCLRATVVAVLLAAWFLGVAALFLARDPYDIGSMRWRTAPHHRGKRAGPHLRIMSDGFGLAEGVWDRTRVEFTKNGALVVSDKGRYVADIGVSLATAGWKRQAYQIRYSYPGDFFGLREETCRLWFSGAVRFNDKGCAARLTQEVRATAWGLEASYGLRCSKEMKAAHVGLSVHVPCRRFLGQRVRFYPGFGEYRFPQSPAKRASPQFIGTQAVVAWPGGDPICLSVPQPCRWWIGDHRPWGQPVFRVWVDAVKCPVGLSRKELIKYSAHFSRTPFVARATCRGGTEVGLLPSGVAVLRAAGEDLLQMGLRGARAGKGKPVDAFTGRACPSFATEQGVAVADLAGSRTSVRLASDAHGVALSLTGEGFASLELVILWKVTAGVKGRVNVDGPIGAMAEQLLKGGKAEARTPVGDDVLQAQPRVSIQCGESCRVEAETEQFTSGTLSVRRLWHVKVLELAFMTRSEGPPAGEAPQARTVRIRVIGRKQDKETEGAAR